MSGKLAVPCAAEAPLHDGPRAILEQVVDLRGTVGERAQDGVQTVAYGLLSSDWLTPRQVSGQYLAANPLHPTAMATTVRVRDGKRFVTDGPFAETREQLGGYFLIDAQHLDEAISIAARIPMARKGTVEIRPVIDLHST